MPRPHKQKRSKKPPTSARQRKRTLLRKARTKNKHLAALRKLRKEARIVGHGKPHEGKVAAKKPGRPAKATSKS